MLLTQLFLATNTNEVEVAATHAVGLTLRTGPKRTPLYAKINFHNSAALLPSHLN